jgi:signal transduction histidine kinase
VGEVARLRLRTQLILATLIISGFIASVCLLLVRYSVKSELNRQRSDAIRASTRAFARVEQEQEMDLTRVAALLSELPTLKALMTSGHAATIQDVSAEFWKLSGADLLVLATPDTRVMGVQAAVSDLSEISVQRMFSASLAHHEETAWWQESNELFRVVIQPIVAGVGTEQRQLGLLAVGRHLDTTFAQELANSSGSQITLVSGDTIVASTMDENSLQEFARQTSFRLPAPQQLRIGNHHFDVSTVALQSSPNVSIRCYMLLPLDATDAYLHGLNSIVLLLGIVAGLVGAALVSIISRAMTGPLETLAGAFRALAAGDYAYSVEARGGLEAVELANAFSGMRQQLMNSQKRQLESERMAALGRAAGSISHDLRHHLAALVANAEFLHDADIHGEDREDIYQEIVRATAQMTGLIDSLVEVARGRTTLTVSQADLQIVVRRAIDAVRSAPEFRGRMIEVVSDDSTTGEFDVLKLERAFFNLLLNACQATNGTRGRLGITLSSDKHMIECRVWDTGCGIPDAIREMLFEPFVSAGKSNGTGLGLAIAARVVHDHGGSIRVEDTSRMGTTFVVRLPRQCVSSSPDAVDARASE